MRQQLSILNVVVAISVMLFFATTIAIAQETCVIHAFGTADKRVDDCPGPDEDRSAVYHFALKDAADRAAAQCRSDGCDSDGMIIKTADDLLEPPVSCIRYADGDGADLFAISEVEVTCRKQESCVDRYIRQLNNCKERYEGTDDYDACVEQAHKADSKCRD